MQDGARGRGAGPNPRLQQDDEQNDDENQDEQSTTDVHPRTSFAESSVPSMASRTGTERVT